MKLKRGQEIDIYKDPFDKTMLEGRATLIKRQPNTMVLTGPPHEEWDVLFEDNESPVRRVIAIEDSKPSVDIFTMSMLSAVARSPECKSLLEFMSRAGLTADWEDPPNHRVTASICGRVLDNRIGSNPMYGSKVNNEILVTLELKDESLREVEYITTLNLNTILALASAYIKQQHEIAEAAIKKQG